MVIMDFYPSYKSVIVRCAMLLDPHTDNYYHATNAWFSPHGYVDLGPFPVLPDNVFLIGKTFKIHYITQWSILSIFVS